MTPDRRAFLQTAATTAAAFTIVPRHVLGGPGIVAPSDKINLAYIGCGTQGLREMIPLLGQPDLHITAVCDPSKDAVAYRDWNKDGLLTTLRRALDKPNWRAGTENEIPGGRDVAQNLTETFYAAKRSQDKFKGCASYADFRELLDKEKDLNAVKIMTPDHLHALIAIAAMKKGKHVITHKPIANRLEEALLTIETARQTGASTHFMPWDSNGSMEPVMAMIRDGSIGTLREIHNWTNRPVWPQFTTLPADRPPVPHGFEWDLWLGPEADRPYHPNYTHMVFRGWYDFGGGAMADMGHYSLWSVFRALHLDAPVSVEPLLSHHVAFDGNVTKQIRNDFSFPTSSIVRFKYPARADRPAVDLVWYEGGMRPPIPDELGPDGALPAEGMMFTGDKGKILAGFRIDSPRLLTPGKPAPPPDSNPPRRRRAPGDVSAGIKQWIAACRGAKQHSEGSFLHAGPISIAVNLYAAALRGGRRLLYDAETRKITNVPDANKYLARTYRKGWDPQSI